ncbi:hypothetical protein [Arthrobacter sp. ok362]|uniref:hypothetical protein n=1 Tax=Arthrobacter sp. ok362 TaxID=1761745 RepID=UPI00088F9DE6|nr:hypothetical protein [Arthrobacter sp. ok362]SDK79934.1 hypothetical protein SAMN04487913_103219 [Arthrobacter sp. ok362]
MATIPKTTVAELKHLQSVCWQNSEDKGFHDSEPTDPEELAIYNGNRLMLIVSEVAEAHEEIRKGHPANHTYYPEPALPSSLVAEVGVERARELIARDNLGKIRKPEGVPSELADIVIRCFDFAESNGFDLGQIIQVKLAYNTSREHMHGKKF